MPTVEVPRHKEIETRQSGANASAFVRANKDPVKTTHAKMALTERGLGAKRAHTKSRSLELRKGGDLGTARQRRACEARWRRASARTLSRFVGEWIS